MSDVITTKEVERKVYALVGGSGPIDMIATQLTGGSFPGWRDVSVHFPVGNPKNIDGQGGGNVFRVVAYRREQVLKGGYYDGVLSHPSFLDEIRLVHSKLDGQDRIFLGEYEYRLCEDGDPDSLIAAIVNTPALKIEMVLEREDSPGVYWVVAYDSFGRRRYHYYDGRRVKNPSFAVWDEADLPLYKIRYVSWNHGVVSGQLTTLLPHAMVDGRVLLIRQAPDYEIAEVAGDLSTLTIRTPEVQRVVPRPGRLLA